MSNEVAPNTRPSLVSKFAGRYGVDPAKLLDTLKATAFKQRDGSAVTNEQMMALLAVADRHGLDPFTKEIFAFGDKGGIVPIVSVDGWARIINSHEAFDGMSFAFADDGSECECTIFRKDRAHPTVISEYLAECKRNTEPWTKWPRRMLRHKAMIQTARIAFGFAGIHDPDEAERIRESRDMGQVDEVVQASPLAKVRAVAAAAKKSKAAPETIDMETGEVAAPVPPAASNAEPKPEVTAPTYAELADRILKATDPETAAQALDLGRDLPEDFYTELTTLYTKKWGGK